MHILCWQGHGQQGHGSGVAGIEQEWRKEDRCFTTNTAALKLDCSSPGDYKLQTAQAPVFAVRSTLVHFCAACWHCRELESSPLLVSPAQRPGGWCGWGPGQKMGQGPVGWSWEEKGGLGNGQVAGNTINRPHCGMLGTESQAQWRPRRQGSPFKVKNWYREDVVCWLRNIPATCECISGTDLLRQFYVLPHWDRSYRPNFPSPRNSILTPGQPVPALSL